MLEMRDTGIEGCRKRGKEERRVQDRRDAEQERCWKGGIQEWRDARNEGRRKGGRKEKRYSGLKGYRKEYRKGGKQKRTVQDRRYAEQE